MQGTVHESSADFGSKNDLIGIKNSKVKTLKKQKPTRRSKFINLLLRISFAFLMLFNWVSKAQIKQWCLQYSAF